MIDVIEMYFLPPLAIGRLGGSDVPLESFQWSPETSFYRPDRTTIEPTVTLQIAGDGTPHPYLPKAIRFRDGEKLRPVAPFFELWVRMRSGDKDVVETPVTLDLLESL